MPIRTRAEPRSCRARDEHRKDDDAHSPQKTPQHQQPTDPTAGLPPLNLKAAGIDVGRAEPYVAVPPDRAPEPVRRFASLTADLHALADWLHACHLDTVVMESTGGIGSPCAKSWKRGALRCTWSTPVTPNTCPGAKPPSPTASGCTNFTPSVCSRLIPAHR